jgi:hypothetical protein
MRPIAAPTARAQGTTATPTPMSAVEASPAIKTHLVRAGRDRLELDHAPAIANANNSAPPAAMTGDATAAITVRLSKPVTKS